MAKNKLQITTVALVYLGQDDWSRDLWEAPWGSVFVDIDGELYTRTPDWEEPCSPTGFKSPQPNLIGDK